MATTKSPKPRPDPQRPPAPVDDELAVLAAEMGMTRSDASRMLCDALIAVLHQEAAAFAAKQAAESDQRGATKATTPDTDAQ